jgi:DNA (cytosine-5)-methyltransferase 1
MSKPTAISLFSGMGGDTLGLTQGGFDVIAFNEYDPSAIESHMANFPDSKLICDPSQKKPKDRNDITKIPDAIFAEYKDKVDLIFAGHPCFVAGTQVLTKNGYKDIEKVTLDDELMTHKNNFKPIVNLQRKNYNGVLYRFDVKYHPHIIECTKEHPFYVRNKNSKASWKEAQQITKNDYFGMVINNDSKIPQFTFQKKVNATAYRDVSLLLDKEEYWFMMGYFIGNGWIQDTVKSNGNNRHIIRFAINDNDIEYVVRKIGEVMNIHDVKCDSGKCKKFGCSDFLWYNILKKFGKYAHNKIIPEWVHEAPIHLISEFIEGYKRADGSVRQNENIRFTTVSQNLALGLQRLYFKLGYIFSVKKTIRDKEAIIDGRVVNQRDTYCVSGYTRELMRKQAAFIQDGYVWFPLFDILSENINDIPVYNFEVKDDNSYVVENVVVHNCQGFSQGGKKLPDDPRNTLFREFARVTKIIYPKFIIGENVDGLLSRKTATGEKYFDVIVKEFNDLGYDVYHKVCNVVQYGVPQLRKRLIYVGVRNDLGKTFQFPDVLNDGKNNLPDLRNIVQFSMEGAIQIFPEDFDMTTIPNECIITDMENQDYQSESVHPYLTLKAKSRNVEYNGVVHNQTLSFAKRDSPIHAEIVDIRYPSKTIICSYDHQPRLFIPLRNYRGFFIRPFTIHELKQIQGFTTHFIIHGNIKNQIKQIGNAAPPTLIYFISNKGILPLCEPRS